MDAPGQVPPCSGGPDGSQVALRTVSLVRPLGVAMGPVLVSLARNPRASCGGTAWGLMAWLVVVMVTGVVVMVIGSS